MDIDLQRDLKSEHENSCLVVEATTVRHDVARGSIG